MDPPSQKIGNASSKLDGCAFTSCGTSCQMGQCSGNKDQRSGKPGHIVLGTHRGKHLVGAPVVLAKLVIKKYNAKAGERQQIKNPLIGLAVTGNCL